jgi:hypothetical protein
LLVLPGDVEFFSPDELTDFFKETSCPVMLVR